MKINSLDIPDVKIIETTYSTDLRGRNVKIFSNDELLKNEIEFSPLEILFLHSNKNVIRGLHYQECYEQRRLIGCNRGKLFVVAIDVMSDSPTRGKYCSYTLQSDNQLVYIPKGYALGTCAIEEADFYCVLADNSFSAEHSKGILWCDENIGINWPIEKKKAIISASDSALPMLQIK